MAVSGMREHRVLARDPGRAVHRDADAAAHADAVDQRDIRLRIFGDRLVRARIPRRRTSPSRPVSPAIACSRMARMSPPAQKARSPAPSITTAWTSGSSRHSSGCAAQARIISRSSAFSTSGRSSRIRPTRPSRQTNALYSEHPSPSNGLTPSSDRYKRPEPSEWSAPEQDVRHRATALPTKPRRAQPARDRHQQHEERRETARSAASPFADLQRLPLDLVRSAAGRERRRR